MLGVGIGWLKEEFEAVGVPFDRRGARLEESVGAMRALWREHCASFAGETVAFTDVYLRPQPPAGAVPIHIGGHTEVAAERAGRIGDGFFPFGVERERLPHLLATMRAAAEAAGRDPAAVEVTVASFAAGTEAARVDVAEAVELGAHRVVVPAALFAGDTGSALAEYGDNVIAPCRSTAGERTVVVPLVSPPTGGTMALETTRRRPSATPTGSALGVRGSSPARTPPSTSTTPARARSTSAWPRRMRPLDRAVAAARTAFDEVPWPRMTHAQRAEYLRALGAGMEARGEAIGQIWPRESGVLHRIAAYSGMGAKGIFDYYAGLADTFEWEREAEPSPARLRPARPGGGGRGGSHHPVERPDHHVCYKVAPALIAGCTVVLKSSPEAPGEAYLLAEAAEEIGLPPGVLNVVTADREVSELLVRDPRVDKITFTGSTAAGRRIASLCGERIARVTLELGGKSAAVVLDDADLGKTAATLAQAECMMTGQVCSSLTRIVVPRPRHDALVEALAGAFSQVRVGNQFDPRPRWARWPSVASATGSRVHREGGGRGGHAGHRRRTSGPPRQGLVRRAHRLRQRRQLLDHRPGRDLRPRAQRDPRGRRADTVAIANDTIYGLNASVFTPDVDRAREVAGQLRPGTVGHNSFRTDFGIAFGGFKQSGIGREGGTEGLLPFLETKTVILEKRPSSHPA